MDAEERKRVVTAWLEIQRNWWAYDTIALQCSEEPFEGWRTIIELVNAADTDKLLGDIGAGPLEDLLHDLGTKIIAEVEAEAARNPKMCIALSNVHLSEHTSETARRLKVLGCK